MNDAWLDDLSLHISAQPHRTIMSAAAIIDIERIAIDIAVGIVIDMWRDSAIDTLIIDWLLLSLMLLLFELILHLPLLWLSQQMHLMHPSNRE